MNKLNITVLQTDIVWENPEANINNIIRLVLSDSETNLFVLPEMFNTGFTNNTDLFAETIDGYTIEKLKELSKISNAAICGSLILKQGDNNYNTFVFIKPDGDVTIYNKRHLFAYGGEVEMFSKGEERVIVEYLGWRINLLVCYDLRFPLWSRNEDNYDMIIYSSNWPASRRNIHDILVKARAIENAAYVVACNRVGEDGKGITYSGGSCIVDYKGEVIIGATDNEICLIKTELDLSNLNDYKKGFPVLLDRDNFKIL